MTPFFFRRTTLVAALMILAACDTGEDQVPASDGSTQVSLEQFAGLMTGSFSSQQHSEQDSSFSDVRLEMARVWPEAAVGIWLYVEQADAAALGAPYRQRVYHLTAEPEGGFRSTIYALPENPLSYAGAWRDDQPLEGLTPSQLILREGCDVFLRSDSIGRVLGKTKEGECTSTLNGAAYATTEIRLIDDQLLSLDRGFNEAGEQVWGSTEGAYVFDRVIW